MILEHILIDEKSAKRRIDLSVFHFALLTSSKKPAD